MIKFSQIAKAVSAGHLTVKASGAPLQDGQGQEGMLPLSKAMAALETL